MENTNGRRTTSSEFNTQVEKNIMQSATQFEVTNISSAMFEGKRK